MILASTTFILSSRIKSLNSGINDVVSLLHLENVFYLSGHNPFVSSNSMLFELPSLSLSSNIPCRVFEGMEKLRLKREK